MFVTLLKDITTLVNSFRNLGMDILDNADKRTFKYPWRFTFLAVGTFMWYMALLRNCIANHKDVDGVISIMALMLQTTLAIVKWMYFLVRKQSFVQLNADSEALAIYANTAETKLWNVEVRTVLPITAAYRIACICTVATCLLLPVLRMIQLYMEHGEVVLIIPLPGIFPFDVTVPFNVVLTYVFFVSLTVFGVSCLVATDGIFSWFVFSIVGHIKILRLKLAQMLQDDTSANFYQQFVQIVFYHRHIIDLAAEFDALFAFIIFLEVTTSCVQFCFLVYVLAFITDVANFIFISMLSSTILMQLLIFCFGGEMLKIESELICDDIYMLSPWQNLPPNVRKLLLLPLMRSQDPMSLTGYFFTANRSLLVWIFRTAGSFVALLFAMKTN